MSHPITTRAFKNYYIDDDNNDATGVARPMIDIALSELAAALYKDPFYSGPIETYWRNGGMQTPTMPGWSKGKGSIMKTDLPANYTGWAVWHLNKGERSGPPRLFDKK